MTVEIDSTHRLNKRRSDAVPRGVASATPIFATRAANAELWDSDDKRYIDFAGGIGVLATGHRHPRVIAAVRDQLERFTHTAFQVVQYEQYVQLAERLNALAPFSGPAQTLLLTTGAEAVENAIKIARVATGRSAVIAFGGAFHGRTQLAMALTGKVAYRRSLGSGVVDVYRVPFPRHPDRSVEQSITAIESLFYTDVEPTRLAAIILEPVQGEGGFNVAPPELLRALRGICDQHGILLIADEIQSGYGRTGRMFAIEHSGVEPDIITVAKSMAGGFPLAGVVGRADIMNCVEPGGLGGTYGGSPIGCAAALAVLEVFEEDRLLDRATVIGEQIRDRLSQIAARSDVVPMANIRGLGAMIGFDVVKDVTTGEPDGAAAKLVTSRALGRGLIILSCGAQGETIRILVPLTISDATLQEGLVMLEQALSASPDR